ncbi:HD domain-containing phosphohydrolase [Aquabacterium sp.]|uniref:HD-GYP domain-containing protein n=1 Tax=Aquabacterium sp. TaxID=1872578 RepID=UPI0025BCB6C3|nr:HD domain-containing phosphohydrolase [Aquabacterium sp.]
MPFDSLVLKNIAMSRSDMTGRLAGLHDIVRARHPAVNRIALVLYEPVKDLLRTFASSSDDGQALRHYEAHLAAVPSLRALAAEHIPRVIDNLDLSLREPSVHSLWLKAQSYQSSYTVPVYAGKRLSAFLFFDSRQAAAFTPDVTTDLDVIADILAQLYVLRMAAVNTLVGAVDVAKGLARMRDVETGAHLERMASYSRLIAVALADSLGLSDEFIEYLHLFAPLHDIGKVGIPDRILLKPGKLDDEERRCMQQHVPVGVQLARNIVSDLGIDNDLAASVMLNVVAHHHERGDGSGYPQGLMLDDIPIEARIVAVADVYDAISSTRPYKRAWSEAECVAELRREAALNRLDARCVEALIAAEAERTHIREALSDGDDLPATLATSG